MVGCGSMNEPQKEDTCLKQIGLSAQNLLTILVNRIGEHYMMISNFTLIMNMVFMQAPKTIKKMAMASTWIR